MGILLLEQNKVQITFDHFEVSSIFRVVKVSLRYNLRPATWFASSGTSSKFFSVPPAYKA